MCAIDLMKKRLFESYDAHLDYAGVNSERFATRLLDIAKIGLTEQGGSCRIGYSKEEKQAKDFFKQWMVEAELVVKEDEAGNIIGRLAGTQDKLPAVVSGSHVDTVPNGGHFDGVLGVLSALEVVEAWKETNFYPDRPFEIIIFSDEEGSRFNTGYIGSSSMMGDVDLEILQSLTDHNEQAFTDIVHRIGLTSNDFPKAQRNGADFHSYVEVHIEQGIQLEEVDIPVGIVTGIAGSYGLEFSFKGIAGHAGNTPMDNRKDALVAASEFILQVNNFPRHISSSAVATVGQLHVYPNGSNVIPGEVKLSVDIRDIYQHSLDKLRDEIIDRAKGISEKSNIKMHWQETLHVEPVLVNEELKKLQAKSIEANQLKPIFIPSGAGHDAMVVGRHVPIAMFFIRSKDGLSHNPKEWSSLKDCIMTVQVLRDFLERLTKST